jgi:peroxiredoxin
MNFELSQTSIRIKAAFFAGFLSCVSVAIAQEESPAELKIGDAAPEWKDLKGIDDKTHSLADLKDKQVVIVCFTCNSCPYAVDYEDRMIELQKKYADHPQGVVLVAINANRKPSEQLDKMKQRAEEKKFSFAYLIDETQQVANSYRANFTPEFFVLNGERKVIFVGAMDDKTDATMVKEKYVEQAIEAALKNELPVTQRVPARGCAIPFKRSRKQ